MSSPSECEDFEKREVKPLPLYKIVQIVKRLFKREDHHILAEAYNISVSTVKDLDANKDSIMKGVERVEADKKLNATKIRESHTNEALWIWLMQQIHKKNTVLENELLTAADIFANIFYSKYFKDVLYLIAKFMKDLGLRFIPKGLLDPHENFRIQIQSKVRAHNLSPEQIYVVDHGLAFWKVFPIEEATPINKLQAFKEKVSFFSCANAAGTHKLKLVIIGEDTGTEMLQNLVSETATYHYNKNSWLTSFFLLYWIKEEFAKNVNNFLSSKKLPKNILLILPDYNFVIDDSLMYDNLNIATLSVPEYGTSSRCSPHEFDIVESMKIRLRKRILALAINRGTDIKQNLLNVDFKDIVKSLAESWSSISPQFIQWSCSKILPDIPLLPYIEDFKDVLLLAQHLDKHLNADKVIEWLLENYAEERRYLSKKEIVEYLLMEYYNQLELMMQTEGHPGIVT